MFLINNKAMSHVQCVCYMSVLLFALFSLD